MVLAEIFMLTAIGSSLYLMYGLLRDSVQKTPDDGSIPWLWNDKRSRFICPKCLSGGNHGTIGNCCECTEHHEAHYHFKCFQCAFKAIMRTADKS